MSDDDRIDYLLAKKELRETTEALEKIQKQRSDASNDKERPILCSFCSKTSAEVDTLIEGPSACICDLCISKCNRLIEDKKNKID